MNVKGFKSNTSLDMRHDPLTQEWVARLHVVFSFSSDLTDWKTIEFDVMSRDKSPERAYQQAIQQILEANLDNETPSFVL